MSAHFDNEVMGHLNELYRQHLRNEAAEISGRGVRRLPGDEKAIFEAVEDFAEVEISQPRRLHLRVF